MLAAEVVPPMLPLPREIRTPRGYPLLCSHELVAHAQMAKHSEGTERQRAAVACIHGVAAHQIQQLHNLQSAPGTPPSTCGALPAVSSIISRQAESTASKYLLRMSF